MRGPMAPVRLGLRLRRLGLGLRLRRLCLRRLGLGLRLQRLGLRLRRGHGGGLRYGERRRFRMTFVDSSCCCGAP